MNTTQAQQKSIDDALVAHADRLEFRKCNMRLKTYIKPKEATIQVVMDALALTPFYQTFIITTEICPKVPGQQFEEPLLEHDILSFLRDVGHSRDIHYITDMSIDYLHQPWRAIASIINKCLSGKDIAYEKIRLDQSVSRRNKMFWHTARDDTMFTFMRCVSRHEKTQKAESDTSPKKKTAPASKGFRLKSSAKVAKTDKKKKPVKIPKTKGLDVLTESKVPDEQQQKVTNTNEGAGVRPELPDMMRKKKKKEKAHDDEEVSSDQREQDKEDDLYRDVNISLERSDAKMTNAQANQDTKDTHDTGIDSILNPNIQSKTLVNVPVSVAVETPFSDTTIRQPPIPNIQPLQQTPETEMSEFRQTNQFAEAISSILGIIDNYLASKMKEAVDVAVQLQINKLIEEAQAENQEFFNQVDSTMKTIIKEQVQAQVSKIMPKTKKYVLESLEAEVLVELYNSDKDIITSYGDVVTLKRGRDDQDKDEDPFAGSNRGSKRRRSGKEAESSKEPTYKESKRELKSKYTTSITKMKAIDYGQVKWIEDKKFYRYSSNMETSKDVYSRHMIITITSLKIMKYFCYSHLEEIIVRRQDDQLYKFKKGDFKRLRRQDIKDMLLLLVQNKLANLNLEERSILTDSKVNPTKHGRTTKPYSSARFIANCFNARYLKMKVKIDHPHAFDKVEVLHLCGIPSSTRDHAFELRMRLEVYWKFVATRIVDNVGQRLRMMLDDVETQIEQLMIKKVLGKAEEVSKIIGEPDAITKKRDHLHETISALKKSKDVFANVAP
nr:hypothetical protein [Tanacetum cinerariifolium]